MIPSVLMGRACLWGTHVGTGRVTYRIEMLNAGPEAYAARSSRGRGSKVGVCREESSRENAKRGAGRRHICLFIRGGFQCPVRMNAFSITTADGARGGFGLSVNWRLPSLHPALRH